MLHLSLKVWARVVAAVIALSITGVGLSACSSSDDIASGTAGAEGFSLALADVQATAGAGVTSQNTSVLLQHEDHAFKQPVRNLVSLGKAVRLSLADNRQPQKPITLSFKIDTSKVPSDHGGFGVLTQSERSARVTFIPGTYNSTTGLLTVKTTHLSWFNPITMAVGSFLSGVANAVLTGLKAQYPEPADCRQDLSAGNVSYSMTAALGAFPCLRAVNDGLQVEFNSTTGIPIRVTPTPRVLGKEEAGVTVDSAVALAVAHVILQDRTTSTLLPGQKVTFSFASESPINHFQLDTDRSTLYLLYTAAVFKAIFEGIPLAKLTDAMDCMSDIQSAQDLSVPSDQLAGLWIRTFINCGGQVAGALPLGGTLWSLVALAPTVVLTGSISTIQQLTNAEHAIVQLTTRNIGPVDLTPYFADSSGTMVRFDSPSHNIECRIFDGAPEYLKPFWQCFINKYAFNDPPKPPDCQYHPENEGLGRSKYGGLFYGMPGSLQGDGNSKGQVDYTCWGGDAIYTQFDGPSPKNYRVLPAGASIKFLDVTCTSSATGEETMTCANSISGAAFQVASNHYKITPPTK